MKALDDPSICGFYDPNAGFQWPHLQKGCGIVLLEKNTEISISSGLMAVHCKPLLSGIFTK
jgi:hypothetical protein